MLASPLFRLDLALMHVSIQERILAPYIPIGRVNPANNDWGIFMKIRNILSLWVFDARSLMGSVGARKNTHGVVAGNMAAKRGAK